MPAAVKGAVVYEIHHSRLGASNLPRCLQRARHLEQWPTGQVRLIASRQPCHSRQPGWVRPKHT